MGIGGQDPKEPKLHLHHPLEHYRHVYPFQSLDTALWSEPQGKWNEDAATSVRSSLETSEAPSPSSLLLRESMGLTTTYHHHRSLWSHHLLPGLAAGPQPGS